MSPNFLLGIAGSLILVIGSALHDRAVRHPIYSLKDWCFAIGALIMFGYSIVNYWSGAPIFFVLLEALVIVASVLMMLNIHEKISTPIIVLISLGLIFWSLTLFDGYGTIILCYREADVDDAVYEQIKDKGFCFTLTQKYQNQLAKK